LALRTFALDPHALVTAKERVAANDRSLAAPLAQLVEEANAALSVGPFSVMQKSIVPPSGDKHDYMSRGRYWWRNPGMPDGLPYVERDGEVNPEIWLIPDHKDFDKLMDNVLTLGLAYFFAEQTQYAEYAARLLRVWFLDEATRMNPHLKYAQGVPGINEGRNAGLIETRELVQIVDAMGLIAHSNAWGIADQAGMVEWFARYLDWLVGDAMAQKEGDQQNNHGTFYDAQVVTLALFLSREELAKKFLQRCTAVRIPAQIAPDGHLPFEMARTLSWHYHVFNLQALYRLASLGERVGLDILNFATQDGRSLRCATDFIAPYVEGKRWEHPQIASQEFGVAFGLLCQAAVKYRDTKYFNAARHARGVNIESHRAHLILNLGKFLS
jgi:alginate lyase